MPRKHEKQPFQGTLSLVLSGGGARGAYQVGVLKGIAKQLPSEFPFQVITGVSAGAINATGLAGFTGTFQEAVEALEESWLDLNTRKVFRTNFGSLTWSMTRWAWMILRGHVSFNVRGLFNTAPLHDYLEQHLPLDGIQQNINEGRLRALALSATHYSSGETVTFLHGRPEIATWARSRRRSVHCRMRSHHVMASAALPLLFPAIPIHGVYYGDGSIRHSSPLAPSVHLGAERILTISLRARESAQRRSLPPVLDRPQYPPPAQVIGMMMHGVFLDALENDAERLLRINRTLEHWPTEARHPDRLRKIELLVLRPSQDLGKLALGLSKHLPTTLRILTGGLGASKSESPDFLSYILFERPYIERLLELGEKDAFDQWGEIEPLFYEKLEQHRRKQR